MKIHFQVHNKISANVGVARNVDHYVATHRWVSIAVTAIASAYGGPIGAAASAAHIANAQGASINDIRTAAQNSYAMARIYPGISEAAGGYLASVGAGKFVSSVVIGGTISALSGGSFKNGAFGAGIFFGLKSGLAGTARGSSNSTLETISASDGIQGSTFLTSALSVVGKVWSLPNTLIGLVYGGVGHIAGLIMGTNPYITIGNNAIQFHNSPLMPSAITLGNVIVYGPSTSPNASNVHFQGTPLNHTVGREEFWHSKQGEVLGPLYLLAHMV